MKSWKSNWKKYRIGFTRNANRFSKRSNWRNKRPTNIRTQSIIFFRSGIQYNQYWVVFNLFFPSCDMRKERKRKEMYIRDEENFYSVCFNHPIDRAMLHHVWSNVEAGDLLVNRQAWRSLSSDPWWKGHRDVRSFCRRDIHRCFAWLIHWFSLVLPRWSARDHREVSGIVRRVNI